MYNVRIPVVSGWSLATKQEEKRRKLQVQELSRQVAAGLRAKERLEKLR